LVVEYWLVGLDSCVSKVGGFTFSEVWLQFKKMKTKLFVQVYNNG
jgi:hypothetical protein